MITPLVGRTGELNILFGAADRASHGGGSLVHLVGEAGAGKSSLLATTAARLRSSRVPVRVAAADETDRRRSGSIVRALLPDAGLPTHDDPVEATIGAVECLAAEGPVALFADDLHWADDSSLEALRAVGRRVEQLGIVLVTAARPRPRPYGLSRFEEMANRDATMLDLAPLADAQLDQLVVNRLGARPGPRLRELLAATEGNPFLATELLASLAGQTVLGTADHRVDVTPGADVPGDLTARLAARVIEAVGGGELLLRALAVVPGGATADELAEMVGRPTSDIVDVVLQAIGAAVLVDTGSTLMFRHELLRRCVQRSTPPSIARTLARLAADVLLAKNVDPERIAACLLAGAERHDPGDVERLIEVGRSLRETHPSSAADLLGAGLRGLSARDPRVGALTIDIGWALVAGGRANDVEALLSERVGPFHDGEPVAVHRLRGVAASLTGRLDVVARRYEDADIGWLVEQYDPDNPDVVDAAAELAMLRSSCGRPGEAVTIADWVDASTTSASAFRVSTVQSVRSQVATAEGRFEDAADHARTASAWAARDETGRASGATPALALAVALDLLGDATGSLSVSRGRATVTTPRWGPPLMQFFGSLTLFRRGDWDDALAEVDAGLVAADEVDLGMGVFWPYSVASLIATARGHPTDAEMWLERSRSTGPERQLGAEWLVHAAVVREEADGHVASAIPLVEAVVTKALGAGAPAVLLIGGGEMVRLALRADRFDLAKTIAHELGAIVAHTRSPVAAGIEAWARGLLDDDPVVVAGAAAMLAAAGRAPEAARAHHGAAVIAARRGDGDRARGWAQQSIATYDALDAAHWRRQLLAELAGAGVQMRPRRRTPRPMSGWASLTDSEATIVGLVGEGQTNTSIAERLFVSRRTVESHLGRVYTKLDLHTRAELVAAAARR